MRLFRGLLAAGLLAAVCALAAPAAADPPCTHTLIVKDATGTTQTLNTTFNGTSQSYCDVLAGITSSGAIDPIKTDGAGGFDHLPLPAGASTAAGQVSALTQLTAIAASTANAATGAGQVAALADLDAIKAAAQAGPTGSAQTSANTKLDAISSALAAPVQPATAPTLANQSAANTKLDTLNSDLGAILAKQPIAPALETGHLAAIDTNTGLNHTDLTAILAKQPATPALETGHLANIDASTSTNHADLGSILAKQPTAPALETGHLAAIDTNTNPLHGDLGAQLTQLQSAVTQLQSAVTQLSTIASNTAALMGTATTTAPALTNGAAAAPSYTLTGLLRTLPSNVDGSVQVGANTILPEKALTGTYACQTLAANTVTLLFSQGNHTHFTTLDVPTGGTQIYIGLDNLVATSGTYAGVPIPAGHYEKFLGDYNGNVEVISTGTPTVCGMGG